MHQCDVSAGDVGLGEILPSLFHWSSADEGGGSSSSPSSSSSSLLPDALVGVAAAPGSLSVWAFSYFLDIRINQFLSFFSALWKHLTLLTFKRNKQTEGLTGQSG